jgi:hypothetical protein
MLNGKGGRIIDWSGVRYPIGIKSNSIRIDELTIGVFIVKIDLRVSFRERGEGIRRVKCVGEGGIGTRVSKGLKEACVGTAPEDIGPHIQNIPWTFKVLGDISRFVDDIDEGDGSGDIDAPVAVHELLEEAVIGGHVVNSCFVHWDIPNPEEGRWH